MSDMIFRKLFITIPPTSNKKSQQKKRFLEQVKGQLSSITTLPIFNSTDRLYGRIFYFNHEKTRIRDIHNIIKPLFDCLEDIVYDDDKQIVHFEGIRLDMEHSSAWFEIEINLSELDAVALTETSCLIEVGRLPISPSNTIKVTWLI